MPRRRSTSATLLFALLLGACHGEHAPEAGAGTSNLAALPGTYAGRLPCRNCPGIDMTLWLRDDGVFFLRQIYLAPDATTAPDRAHKLGRWTFDTASRTLVLHGRGPELRFALSEGGKLEMRTGSPEPQTLTREPTLGPFDDSVRLEGEYVVAPAPETFRECDTGLVLALADDAGGRELRRQRSSVSRPDTRVLATVEAHFLSGPTSMLAIERVISIRPGVSCEASSPG